MSGPHIQRDVQVPVITHISQRVVYSYLQGLAPDSSLQTEGISESATASRKDLHDFFHILYRQLFDHADRFGLPTQEDASILDEESEGTARKSQLNRMLKKPRDIISEGMHFLYLAGSNGRIADGQTLVLDQEIINVYLATQPSRKKKFLDGMRDAGLCIQEEDGSVALKNDAFPLMMPALIELAEVCSLHESENIRHFFFARCDYRRKLDALELYRIFSDSQLSELLPLHQELLQSGFKTSFQIYGTHGWEVIYSSKKAFKATSFLHIEYSERFQDPLRARVKCVSSERLLPHLSKYPLLLQEDFFNRAYPCGNCGWCKERKGLRPSLLQVNGKEKKICWHVNSSIKEFNRESAILIRQYVSLHEDVAMA